MQPTCAIIYTHDSIESSRLNDSKFYLRVLGLRLGWVQGHASGGSETKRDRPGPLAQDGKLQVSERANVSARQLWGNQHMTVKSFLTALHIGLVHKALKTENKTMRKDVCQLAGRSLNS